MTEHHRPQPSGREWVLLVCLIVTVLSVAATAVWAHSQSDARRDAQIASCERGNAARQAIDALIALHPQTNLEPLPLVNCTEAVN